MRAFLPTGNRGVSRSQLYSHTQTTANDKEPPRYTCHHRRPIAIVRLPISIRIPHPLLHIEPFPTLVLLLPRRRFLLFCFVNRREQPRPGQEAQEEGGRAAAAAAVVIVWQEDAHGQGRRRCQWLLGSGGSCWWWW